MLLSIKAKNCFLFDKEVELSAQADMRYRNFAGNVAEKGGKHILKSLIVLGPNNAGKTMLTRCIAAVQDIMLNQARPDVDSNLFTASDIAELGVRFVYRGHIYTFEVHYDTERREFEFERLALSEPGKSERDIYTRDTRRNVFRCDGDGALAAVLPSISRDNILIYLLDPDKFDVLRKAKDAIVGFASSIDVIDMNTISMMRTVEHLKDKKRSGKIREFVLNADLSLDDFRYDEDLAALLDSRGVLEAGKGTKPPGKGSDELAGAGRDILSLTSVYHGKPMPSVLFDSRGTMSIEALAAYVIDALEEGRILVIDALDNGLHFRLTRAIVSLFNNPSNQAAQLIATTHDPTLLDCKKLFRKEQIWFAHKDIDGAYLYSLADFTAREHGTRDTSDLLGKYKEGAFGALPDPDLFPLLMELEGDE